MVKNRDQMYLNKLGNVDKFIFDDKVASVFEDMISRSVPGYDQILQLVPTLVKRFKHLDGNCYDLGCSLGAGMAAIAQGYEDSNSIETGSTNIIGIDTSSDMLSEAKNLLSKTNFQNTKFELRCENITNNAIERAALVLMNFTLQFIPLDQRDKLIQSIFKNLVAGGALVLSEKIKFADSATDQTLIDLHHQFKADQGYSDLEISQKREAIDDVLIPETLESHINRLQEAGFKITTPWIQNLQFISILAIK